ncbi:MAG: surface-adhesin E family protein [Syntrophus sp. (in: bacteria)]
MMKYSKWRLNVSIFCFFVLLGGCGYALAAEESMWSFVGFTKYRDAIFIDKAHLSRPSTGKVLVSARIEPSAKSLFRGNIKREVPQYRKSLKNFKYLIMEIELSCPEDRLRFREIKFFDKEGKVLHTAAYPDAPWKPIKPGGLWKDLEGAVCP